MDFAEEMAVKFPQHGWNMLHIAVIHGWMRTPGVLHRYLLQQIEQLGTDAPAVDRALEFVALALSDQGVETLRSPLHSAAVMHGVNSSIFRALVALERCVRSRGMGVRACLCQSLRRPVLVACLSTTLPSTEMPLDAPPFIYRAGHCCCCDGDVARRSTATRRPPDMDSNMLAQNIDLTLSPTGDLLRYKDLLDIHDNTPIDYCQGTASFTTPDDAWHTEDVSPETYHM